MKPKEILIIGAGIAGCAVGLALAKRGIPVTIITSSFDQRIYPPYLKIESLEERLENLKESNLQLGCSKAMEQITTTARRSFDELLETHLQLDRHGTIDIHRCLLDQLKLIQHVEWYSQYTVVELLTLEHHSEKKADVYKKSACMGIYAYNHQTKQVEKILAKETILATGGATSLFPYSTNINTATGSGFAMAFQAGARLVNMEQIVFHPMALYSKGNPCVPLPLDLLKEGGILHASKNLPLEHPIIDGDLSLHFYDELLKTHTENLFLDLTLLDPISIKEKFPFVDISCLNYGYNIAKDLIPVGPAAQYSCGGVAVDKTAQTSIQRLRAVGEVAATGLCDEYYDKSISLLESLTWAVACAEDISKQIQKFVYYFPQLREWNKNTQMSIPVVQEDFALLKQIMWNYVGIKRDYPHLRRGYDLLRNLKMHNDEESRNLFSIERIHLQQAIQAALLITQAALDKTERQAAKAEVCDALVYSVR
ncbi:MAG: FAD-binding protein [Parachlamydiaceae bacterium]|nr:FAD-binding protein [Parachlamydiaceae bacterium]